jgi:hypothetical protein
VGKPRARRNGTIAIRVQAPAAGLLTVRGRGRRAAIRRARATATRAGRLTVRVRPSRAGKRLLRKRSRTRVKAVLVFTPVGGAPQRSVRVLTLERPRGR